MRCAIWMKSRREKSVHMNAKGMQSAAPLTPRERFRTGFGKIRGQVSSRDQPYPFVLGPVGTQTRKEIAGNENSSGL